METENSNSQTLDKLQLIPKYGASFTIKLILFSLLNLGVLGFLTYSSITIKYLLISIIIFLSIPFFIFLLLYLALDSASDFIEGVKKLKIDLKDRLKKQKVDEKEKKSIGFFDIITFSQNIYTIYQIAKDNGEITDLFGIESLLVSPFFYFLLIFAFILHIIFTIITFIYAIWYIF